MNLKKLTPERLKLAKSLIKKVKKHAPNEMWLRIIVFQDLKRYGWEREDLIKLDKYFV